MKPRLLIILNRFSIGGPAANTLALAQALSNEFEILLIAGKPGAGEHSAAHLLTRCNGFRVELLEDIRREILPLQDLRTYFKIRNIISSFQPHIVHTHGSKPGVLGRIAAWKAGVPVVVHTFHGHVFHSYFSRPVSRVIVFLERWLARHTHILLAINQKLKAELEEVYHIASSEKIMLNPLGIEYERLQNIDAAVRNDFRAQWQLQPNETAVAIIGRLVPVKQHQLFVEMADLLLNREADRNFRFFIIGDGEEKTRIMHLIQQYGRTYRTSTDEAPADFTFTSWQTDIRNSLAGIDLLVLTSLNEGTPVSILEAMAAAKPVVATPVGGIPELFRESGAGLTGATAEELAQQVQKVLNDSTLQKNQLEMGVTFIKRHRSISLQAKALAAIFRKHLPI